METTKAAFENAYNALCNKEALINELLQNYHDTDNDGQIVIYTGRYRWTDGSIHLEPECNNSQEMVE